jgi:cytochrome o ubiquinol oxidase subunit 3
VAIGVLWLIMMYVRSFKPVDALRHAGSWILTNVLLFAIFAGEAILSIMKVLGIFHVAETEGYGPAMLEEFGKHYWPVYLGAAACIAALWRLATRGGPVEFDERHAVDVEMMGLYWHFVDIVWIVIFTAVYLLEYVFPAGPIPV